MKKSVSSEPACVISSQKQPVNPKNPQSYKHGYYGTPTYRSWRSMKNRCLNKNQPSYAHYGAVGISICERWNSFENFLSDVGERPAGTSLDRHPDKGGNYEPGNVRWATRKQQQRNMKSNKPLFYNGMALLLVDWSHLTGISESTINGRLRCGWPIAKALTKKPRVYSSSSA